MQDIFDKLYEKSCNGYKFNDLMNIISNKSNILLAYRNIKNNRGSNTKGTDGRTISHYKEWSEEKFVRYFQEKLQNYFPKSVRRVNIPKPNGKIRPLGIPCMDDRIIQQCIKQVLEPICEAKFHKHSYGFRPNRATSHAIARMYNLMKQSRLHYVVDIDIKGFFDNVQHGKLMKQLWSIGIQDKNLLSVMSKILKSEIDGEGIPTKGVPQGGIISPLLSNVVLNELDWWLSDQWETLETRHTYSTGHKFRALKTTNLKEFFFVRYADDFKILCRDYKTAQIMLTATKDWLKERLGLDISPEKSKITNLRKRKAEFLGFEIYVKKKRNEYVTQSNISSKAAKTMTEKLQKQIRVIQHKPTHQEAIKLNAKIIGFHQYYQLATNASRTFHDIDFIVRKSLENRLKKTLTTKQKRSRSYLRIYGKYKTGKVYTVARVVLFPIYGCTFKAPMNFKPEINNYTEHGRTLIHDKLSGTSSYFPYLLSSKYANYPVEYLDNRISLMAAQNGKCFITKRPLEIGNMECHHKKPKHLGGTDEYKNLVWVSSPIHKLIHATRAETINKYLQMLKLNDEQLKKS